MRTLHLLVCWASVLVVSMLNELNLLPQWLTWLACKSCKVTGMRMSQLCVTSAAFALGCWLADIHLHAWMFRGMRVSLFDDWPELQRLRYAYSRLVQDKEVEQKVLSRSAIFVSPASLVVSPIWFKAVAKDETWRWYWTPYAQHKGCDWMPVSKSTVDTRPSRIYQGQIPAERNVRIIQFLRDNESETAEKALFATCVAHSKRLIIEAV